MVNRLLTLASQSERGPNRDRPGASPHAPLPDSRDPIPFTWGAPPRLPLVPFLRLAAGRQNTQKPCNRRRPCIRHLRKTRRIAVYPIFTGVRETGDPIEPVSGEFGRWDRLRPGDFGGEEVIRKRTRRGCARISGGVAERWCWWG